MQHITMNDVNRYQSRFDRWRFAEVISAGDHEALDLCQSGCCQAYESIQILPPQPFYGLFPGPPM